MTKEELAKKKGLKAKTSIQNAAESLITAQKQIGIELKEEGQKPDTSDLRRPERDVLSKDEKVNSKTFEKQQKAGRPKGKPSTKISLNVPNEYLELVEIAAGINFRGNTSGYIVSLIENDIKKNGKLYEQIKNLKA